MGPAYAGPPLPAGWEPVWSTSKAKHYFQHARTGEKTWKVERAWAREEAAAAAVAEYNWQENPLRGRSPSVVSSALSAATAGSSAFEGASGRATRANSVRSAAGSACSGAAATGTASGAAINAAPAAAPAADGGRA